MPGSQIENIIIQNDNSMIKQKYSRGVQFLNNVMLITCFHELSLLGLVKICLIVPILKGMHG